MPTLSLIISNDFLALTMAQWCFLLLSHRLKPTQKAIPPLLPLDISMQHPPPSQTPNRNYYSQGACLFLYSFLARQRCSFFAKTFTGSHCEVIFFFFLSRPAPLLNWLRARLRRCQNTTSPAPPHAKCGIRRIMPMSDFHRRAVVYYRCGKSLFNTFCLCELQKMGRRTMLDRGKGGRISLRGWSAQTLVQRVW